MSVPAALALVVMACAQAAAPGLELRVEAASTKVEFGRAFELVVTRVWPKTLVPEPWTDQALSPLVLRLRSRKRKDLGARIEETLRFDAYAFVRASLRVPAPVLTASAPGIIRTAAGNGLRLSVQPAIGDGDGREAELPRGPFAAPASPMMLVLIGSVLVAATAIAWSRYRRREEPGVVSEPDPSWTIALRRLDRLREHVPESFEDHRRDALDVSRIVRDYLLARFGINARELTTEQLLGDRRTASLLDDRTRELLTGLLDHCDRVKFAHDERAALDRETRFSRARDLIAATEPQQSRPGAA